MALPLGLISKSLVGLVSVGGIGTGTWVFFAKSSWTRLDEEIFEGSGSWQWTSTPTNDGSLSAGSEPKIEITGTLTTSGTNTSKTWKCTIKGKMPKTLETNATSKISEQLTTLKSAVGGGENNATWQPSSNQDKKTAAEKFFSSCIKNRTWEEWSEARKGNKGESTIHLEIVKVGGSSTDYKFNEEAFKKLYS